VSISATPVIISGTGFPLILDALTKVECMPTFSKMRGPSMCKVSTSKLKLKVTGGPGFGGLFSLLKKDAEAVQ